jgi:hypothetical protein
MPGWVLSCLMARKGFGTRQIIDADIHIAPPKDLFCYNPYADQTVCIHGICLVGELTHQASKNKSYQRIYYGSQANQPNG